MSRTTRKTAVGACPDDTTRRAKALGVCLVASILAVAGCSKSNDSGSSGSASSGTTSGGGGGSGAVIEAAANLPAGWAATFTNGDASAHSLTPTASFALDSGESVHPAVKAQGFTATYEAVLTIERPGKYHFGAEIEGGEASVTVQPGSGKASTTELAADGETTFSDLVDLPAGPVRVTYSFTRDGDARARFRPLWEMDRDGLEGFGDEPIPSRFVRVSTSVADEAEAWMSVERGRVLLGDFGCVQCHGGSEAAAAARVAPDLSHVAQRADGDWMAKWIESPQDLKPGSGMPDVIENRDDAHALVAYLQSLTPAGDWPAAATEANVIQAGQAVFESAGCIACHGTASGEHNDNWAPRYPYGNLTGKWNPAALSAYLQPAGEGEGAHHRASMKLSDQEADLVATYLVSVWGAGDGGASATDDALVSHGATLFASEGCASCHGMDGVDSQMAAKPLSDLDAIKGCLDASDSTTPRYTLTERQRADLRAAVEEVSGWTANAHAPADHAHIAVQTLNCVACHNWHDRGGVAAPVRDYFTTVEDTDLGDEGRFPPRLEGVGWKLTNAWLGQVIGDGARARPYMLARMPVFDTPHAHALVDELAQLDGVWPGVDSREPEVTDTMVQGGLKLAGTAGLNCIACHTFGNRPPVGLPGPNIAQFGERLRYDWWHRYVLNPPRFKPNTRMPNFFLTGSSPISSVAEGNPHGQADAMWAYFSLGELFMPAPEGVITPGGMEIVVTDEPTVLRTFLKDVGARGIAVGFPAGLHFAYDANTSRLRYAWTGSFIDASGAWAGRGGNIVGGQGPTVWTASDGPALAIGDKPASWKDAPMPSFAGYHLDDAGVPTFLSTLGDAKIAETIRPYPHAGALFARTIEITGLITGQTVWLPAGERIELPTVNGGSAESVDGFWRVRAEGESLTLVLEVMP